MSTDGENALETGDEDSLLQAIVAIRVLMFTGQQFRQAVADHFGVGLSETFAMNHLAIAGPLTPRELAARVGLTPSSVTALLDRLAHAGMAERTAHPTDRRQIVITLTAHGATMQDQVQQWIHAALTTLDYDRLAQTITALTDVSTALGAQTAKIREETSAGDP